MKNYLVIKNYEIQKTQDKCLEFFIISNRLKKDAYYFIK